MTLDALTPRERAVLEMKCDYYSNKEIARQLGMTEHTVKNHFQNARQKFGAIGAGEVCRRARLQIGMRDAQTLAHS